MGERPVRRPLTRGAAAVGLLAGGSIVAVCALAVHGRWWGLLLGLAATSVTLWALPARWWARTPYAAGWAVAVVVATAGRREGDFAVASDIGGYAMVLMVIPVTLVGVLALRRPRPRRGEDSGGFAPTS